MAPILVGAVVDNPPALRKRTPAVNDARRRGPSQYYDAAQTTDENRRHWANADSFSAAWANNPAVRRTLRSRSRYEQANNGYAKRACKTSANDIFGRRGPRCRFAFSDPEMNRFLDSEFVKWMRATGFKRKLKTFLRAKKGDGEAVAILGTNPALPTPVKLDLKLIEGEQLATPGIAFSNKGEIRDRFGAVADWMTDGILFDAWGNPTEYHVLKQHPGDGYFTEAQDFDRLPADKVIHWFDAERPGQVRGVPEGTTSLPLFAQLRRFTGASVSAAEIQACYAGVLETENTADPDEPADAIPGIEIERGMIPSLPDGYKFKGVNPTHPTATYPEFKREVLAEAGAGAGLPYNVLAADSSRHNYSSARLDQQDYHDDVAIERGDVEEVVLDRVKDAWLAEAILIPGYLPSPLQEYDGCAPCEWFWSGFGFIDPVKEATAIVTRLQNHLTTLKAVHAANGDDWREVLEQRAAEIAMCKELGIPLSMALPTTKAPPAQDSPSDQADAEDDGEDAGDDPAEQRRALPWNR